MYLQIFEQGFQISPQIWTNFGFLKIVEICVAGVQSVPGAKAAAKTRINTFYVNESPLSNMSINMTKASGGHFEMGLLFVITASESVLSFCLCLLVAGWYCSY